MARISCLWPLLALLAAAVPAAAQSDCAVCFGSQQPAKGEQPLSIEISAGLEFSRLALTGRGDGRATIDPQSGAKRTSGNMIDLGGIAVQGRGRITGMPGRTVRIELPQSVTMTAANGTSAELTGLATDLPAWPVLDASGNLEFAFGGQLHVAGPVGGNFRGRIPITVDYN